MKLTIFRETNSPDKLPMINAFSPVSGPCRGERAIEPFKNVERRTDWLGESACSWQRKCDRKRGESDTHGKTTGKRPMEERRDPSTKDRRPHKTSRTIDKTLSSNHRGKLAATNSKRNPFNHGDGSRRRSRRRRWRSSTTTRRWRWSQW